MLPLLKVVLEIGPSRGRGAVARAKKARRVPAYGAFLEGAAKVDAEVTRVVGQLKKRRMVLPLAPSRFGRRGDNYPDTGGRSWRRT